MSLSIQAPPVPLQADSDGVVRVAGTRVTLDTVVQAFCEGATAEEIAQQYSVLDLGAVYAVISYYLANRTEVDAYLSQRAGHAQQVRQANESRFSNEGLRERLLARRKPQ